VKLPLALKLYATLTFVSAAVGLGHAAFMVFRQGSVGTRSLLFELGLAAFQVCLGIGILRRRPAWRIVTLVCCWFIFVVFVTVLLSWCLSPDLVSWPVLAAATAALALNVWVYLVLWRPDVRALFRERPDAQRNVKRTVLIVSSATLIGIGWLIYLYVIPLVGMIFGVFPSMRAQMTVGEVYMDSLTEKDIQEWIVRTNTLLSEYEPGTQPIGVYGSSGKAIPPDLSELKIIRIDVSENRVSYVWMGGLDHTELEVHRLNNGIFIFTAHYNDERSRVIWPKE
jgi:hypothetical protein